MAAGFLRPCRFFYACGDGSGRMEWRPMIACRWVGQKIGVFLLGFVLASAFACAAEPTINLVDGFDFPVGKPNAEGFYKSRGLRLREPKHLGEDWNGRAGGNSDLGAPVYAIGDGVVTFAHNVRAAWGNVVITRHAYRDTANGKIKYCDALNGHLNEILVKVGQRIKRGQPIGSIGTNFGMYPAHLHFELRHNITIGMARNSVPVDLNNWADPSDFINKHRRMNREWRAVSLPVGTYEVFAGFKGL